MADSSVAGVVVRDLGERRFEVRVAAGSTRHVVTVDDAALRALGWADPAAIAPTVGELSALVAASFDYLLEREPATSILARFDLSVIEAYFPGYFADIRARIG